MALKLITAPTVEPILLADMKASMRVIDSYDDSFISELITASREACEQITRRALITQTWLMTLDKFPAPGLETSSANWYGPAWGTGPGPLTVTRPDGQTLFEIWVPKCPVVSIDSIKYIDQNGALQTLDPTQYVVDTASQPARITPAVNVSWPATQNVVNAVQVQFTCGYGADGSFVPAKAKSWMRIMTSTLYENREMVAILNRGQIHEMPYIDAYLDNLRVQTFDPPSYW